jgi:hypothetical protein
MRRSDWTPSIVPNDYDDTVYLVADDFGRIGRAWREADYEATDLETVISDLLSGQYSNPPRSRLQHCRAMVRGRFGRCRPRTTPPMRLADV